MNKRKSIICGIIAGGLVATVALAVLFCKLKSASQEKDDSPGEVHRWQDPAYTAMIKERIAENHDLAVVASAAREKLRAAKEAGASEAELAPLQKAYDEALLAMERQRAATQVKIAERMRSEQAKGIQFQQKKGH